MLSRYDNKDVRITTFDGLTLTGRADFYPSGYGLHEFGTFEESIQIEDTQVFLSEIVSIDVLSELTEGGSALLKDHSELMAKLLEQPYWIVDILPKQVPPDASGQYFAIDRYRRRPGLLAQLHRKHAEMLLSLNCYYDMTVSFDACKTWETNPKPVWFVEQVVSLAGNSSLRALFVEQETMIDIDPNDTWMTVYSLNPEVLDLLYKLSTAAGFFLWQPPKS